MANDLTRTVEPSAVVQHERYADGYWSALIGRPAAKLGPRKEAGTASAVSASVPAQYESVVLPRLAEVEKDRAAALQAFRRRTLPSLAGVAAATVAALSIAPIVLPAIGIFALGLAAWCRQPISRFRVRMTDIVCPVVSTYLSPTLNYREDSPKPIALFEHLGILPGFDTETSRHYFTGDVDGTTFQLFTFELLRMPKGRYRRRPPQTIAEGIFLICDIERYCYEKTLLLGNANGATFPEFRTAIEDFALSPSPLPQTDAALTYQAYTADPHEADALLSAGFLTAAADFAAAFGAPECRICFYRGRMFTMLPTQHLPAISLFDRADPAAGIRTMLRGLEAVPTFIRAVVAPRNGTD